MSKIKRALISVSDKSGLLELARFLSSQDIEILSTGGTQKLLSENKIPVIPVEEYTGFPEMMDGRVKTLHPKIHGGLLGVRGNDEHIRAMESYGIVPIDLVIVNLYPFVKTVANPNVTLEDAIENIDIGGPSMLRAAAKNYPSVTVITEPSDYKALMRQLKENANKTSLEYRFQMAAKVFSACAAYDGAISNFLTSLTGSLEPMQRKLFSQTLTLQYQKAFDLRYGENPHQEAAFYLEPSIAEPCVSNAKQLHGKQLSYNNIFDMDGALETVKEFNKAACAIIKHSNPCGVATTDGAIVDAFLKALACDATSAFGGIIAFNREVDETTASEIAKSFFEAVVAPDFSETALEILTQKKNIRLLQTPPLNHCEQLGWDMKKVVGGMLVQGRDNLMKSASESKIVTKRAPSPEEIRGLDFAWRVVKHVKSNAIVYAREDRTVGIGAGQMSRVDSSKIGVLKAASSIKGTVMASDAFFPFRDSIDEAAKNGVTAIIQPGGSIRDEEVIQAADEHGMAMVFTEMRHFRH